MFKLLLLFFFIQSSSASNERFDEDVYLKCHKQFLNKRAQKNTPILLSIRDGSLTGTKACINLLKKASLNKRLQLKLQNQDSITILKNIQLLHNSWFKLYNFNRETQDHGVTNTIDSNQMAYQYTAALLSKDIDYSSTFTSTEPLWAKRKGNEFNKYSNDKDIQGRRSKIDGTGLRKWQVGGIEDNPDDFGATYFFTPRLVEYGQLIGFTKVKNHLEFSRLKNGQKLGKASITRNLFPGIFGSAPYLMLNLGHDDETTDGGYKLHRRFSSNFFSDFLCRDLPVLNKEDIHPIKNSKIPFKSQQNCMSCHETMDQLANITSNLEPFNAGEVHTNAYTFRAIFQHSIRSKKIYNNSDFDKNYYKKKHRTKLYFRDYRGNLINEDIDSPSDLGKVLAKLDDPYLCTVSRYFSFLTGIEVDINNFSKIEKDNKIKKILVSLTKDLKSNQKPIEIFEKIFNSPYYLNVQPEHRNE